MAIAEETQGTQGAVINEAPVEIIYLDDYIKLGIKNKSFCLKIPKRFVRGSRDVMTLRDFVSDVYKAGFSDCADKLMNPDKNNKVSGAVKSPFLD